jgi:hypothetical protein
LDRGRKMNIQTIQFTILLLDSFIKLAPWRAVTDAIGRIAHVSGKNLARSLRLVIPLVAGLSLIAMASIFGPAFLAGYFVGVFPLHVSRGSLVLSYAVSGLYLGVMLWRGLRLRDRRSVCRSQAC